MRLINCSTLQLEEFFGNKIPPYAILSHTWGDDEVTFDHLPFTESTKARKGYQKIAFTCAQAIQDGLDYAWVDTCSIDKRSSSELSEAINSMYAWYSNADRCYVYLSDVRKDNMNQRFPESRWFRRGWTLQELLAPKEVVFYDQQWETLGTRLKHAEWISEIARIDVQALLGPLSNKVGNDYFCVAKKMSWASERDTTRREDMAYCLLGIFDVNMPLLYGEGDHAFIRLQEEILRKTNDDSILAWRLAPTIDHPRGAVLEYTNEELATTYPLYTGVLASSPHDFKNCADLQFFSRSTSTFTLTNVGLQIQLPLVPVVNQSYGNNQDGYKRFVGLLGCSFNRKSAFLGIPLLQPNYDHLSGTRQMYRCLVNKQWSTPYSGTIVLGPRAVAMASPSMIVISRHKSTELFGSRWSFHQHFVIDAAKTLEQVGYRIEDETSITCTQANGYGANNSMIWDADALVFTVFEGLTSPLFDMVIGFCFERQSAQYNSRFTVFLHNVSGKTTIREGGGFSRDDKDTVLSHLIEKTEESNIDSITLLIDEGNILKVSASAHMRQIYCHQVFTVVVDAIPIVAGSVISERITR